MNTPNLPTNIVSTNIARLKLSGKLPMYLRIPPLEIKIMLESNPVKSTMLVGGLGVAYARVRAAADEYNRGGFYFVCVMKLYNW